MSLTYVSKTNVFKITFDKNRLTATCYAKAVKETKKEISIRSLPKNRFKSILCKTQPYTTYLTITSYTKTANKNKLIYFSQKMCLQILFTHKKLHFVALLGIRTRSMQLSANYKNLT